LLEAVAHALPAHPTLRLVLIGEGHSQGELEQYAYHLGIAHRVEFTGKVPFDDIPDYLPVVAVNATGTRDVIRNGVDGLLTENDSAALAGAICQVLENEGLYQTFKAAALNRAKDFDLTRQSQRLVEVVYHQAIEDKKADRTVVVPKAKKFLNVALETGPLRQMRDLITEIARD
jgi:glycosyltransferase involved in cell wall biosynthesis